VLIDHEPPPAPPRADAEALIREARRRSRRRRLRITIAAVVPIGVAALAFLSSAGGGSGTVAATAGRPFVDVNAFRHQGELAFISRGTLWVLDGAAGSLRKVAATTVDSQSTPVVPGSPTFSHDGRWLAFLATPQSADGSPSQLWIAHGDGTGAHEVTGLAVDQLVGWSPTADELAVVADARGWDFSGLQDQRPVKVEVVSASGAARLLLALTTSARRPGRVDGAAWAPNGEQLAVSVANPRLSISAVVRAYPLAGGKPTTWFSIAANRALPGSCSGGCGGEQVIAHLAGWWPRWGMAFWSYCCGATHNSDNTPLELLSVPGAQPRLIAQTLSDGATDAVAAGPDGALAVVATTTEGRDIGQGKAVANCDARTQACVPVPRGSIWTAPNRQCTYFSGAPCSAPPRSGTPGSGVSLDPAWSPTAPLLAYVKAPYSFDPAVAWYAAHELFLWNRRTGSTARLAAVSGASVPTWSRDGRDLLYVSGDGLWLAPVAGGKPVEIEHPLFSQRQWSTIGTTATISYYGQIDWTGQFSWSSP
jgi:hypothetical protein